MRINWLKINLATTVVTMLLFSCGYLSQYDDIDSQQKLYCNMVNIYEQSGGEYGWPDYQENAQIICN